MKKHTIRILGGLVVSFALVFALTGCGAKTQETKAPNQEQTTTASQPNRADLLVTADERRFIWQI